MAAWCQILLARPSRIVGFSVDPVGIWVGMTTWAFGHSKAISPFSLRVSVFFRTPTGSAQWSDLGRPSLVPTPEVFTILPPHFPDMRNDPETLVMAADPIGGGAASLGLISFRVLCSRRASPVRRPGCLSWCSAAFTIPWPSHLQRVFEHSFFFFHNHFLMDEPMCH